MKRRTLVQWTQRTLLVLVLGFVVLYGGDWAVFTMRGSPTSSVSVNQFMSVPLKGNKVEYDYVGTDQVTCSVSLFPQGGQSPCWRLRRNANQTKAF